MYKRGEKWWAWVHLDNARKQISLGTSVRSLAQEMERMLDILRSRRAWKLLRAAAVDEVITLGKLYDSFREGEHALVKLESELDDVDLNQQVEGWQRWAKKTASEETVDRYLEQLRVLMPAGKIFPRSQFTRKTLSSALAGLPGSGSTGRRYFAAWSSFGRYLVEVEVIEHNPLRDVRAPSANDPRENFLELGDVQRYVDAHPEPFRTIAALREGAGVEISAALRVKAKDLGAGAAVVQVHGTKNAWRQRPVYVEFWAREYLMAAAENLHPEAFLFDGVSYWDTLEQHRAALKAAHLPKDYRMHDARHSFAVRWMRAGIDPNLIAANLGHKDATLVMRVYGKYRPRAVDFTKLDQQTESVRRQA